MTDLKDRCHKVMLDHLTSKGYPNMTRKQILHQVKDLWNALDVAGLMPQIKAAGHSYQSFCDAALRKAQEAAFDEFAQGMAETVSKNQRRTK